MRQKNQWSFSTLTPKEIDSILALHKNKYVVKRTAKYLEIDRSTLSKRLRKLIIKYPDLFEIDSEPKSRNYKLRISKLSIKGLKILRQLELIIKLYKNINMMIGHISI